MAQKGIASVQTNADGARLVDLTAASSSEPLVGLPPIDLSGREAGWCESMPRLRTPECRQSDVDN
ncbi:hypothetical protein [Nocardia brasiliensis]|uniref:hypothetical protein n=1 Tax=Nocardia brasiliensis TaxID=37326 RepID=UPI00366A91B3